MELCGWRLGELTAIVVVHGPGSFTGVRVGVSAAKGLSEAGGGVALIAISRLALVAAAEGEGEGLVHSVLDAGRGQFYYGRMRARRCLREALLTEEEVVAASSGGRMAVVCEAKVAEELAGLRLRLVAEPVAGDALPLALERIERGEFDDAMTLDANYLRQTDTEILAKMKSGRTQGEGDDVRVRVGAVRMWTRWCCLERATELAPHWAAEEYATIVNDMGEVRRRLLVAEGEVGLVGFAVGKVVRIGGEQRRSWRAWR